MKPWMSSKWNYYACFFCVIATLVCAVTHDLPFLLLNFFFAVTNWYLGEWKRGIENETNKDGKATDSDSDAGDDETQE